MVKFLHCADLHLDSPFVSKQHLSPSILRDVENSAYESFRTIVDIALREQVDFVIISGDLFDQHNRTLKAEVFLKEEFERLQKEQIFVYIVHGNHDPLSERITSNWPSNVTVFSNKVETYQAITKTGDKVHIHGFSYETDASYENKIDDYPTNEDRQAIHIGVLHGTYSKSGISDRYTEFRLEDLNKKLYHYWALGHIHKRQQLSDLPEINYPGNIQGRHFKEQGEKGCLIVEGDYAKLETRFVPTQFIRFESATLDVTQITQQGLYEAIQAFKDSVRGFGRAFYRLQLNVPGDERIDHQVLEQVKAMIIDYEENEQHFVMIDSLDIHYTELETPSIFEEFDEELLKKDEIYEAALSDLYMNPKASKYLDHYMEHDRQALIKRAEEMIQAELKGVDKR
ncbi:DNA repair exonuclease [Staphylococcus muscae]|uniref:DNA repair exonuclease n=1 Tax=Staphylococcus muscae TaxID=1294 RepID=A0A240C6Y1_9STAP|nr:DNA repair exonuclease [Staphylococcus muscae]AVQ33347.1 DNA repair exonuclease [Staphylococcus muscae]PNZ02450.1 DNA repair exonuclease [Staphylococcus muscae]GGA94353.1 DNA repair exonuclease [Staphylococcus muscae]SNW03063.1 DNA repair exonuclease family protein [Staphylococcus muscae]